jgi:hypothetical protein
MVRPQNLKWLRVMSMASSCPSLVTWTHETRQRHITTKHTTTIIIIIIIIIYTENNNMKAGPAIVVLLHHGIPNCFHYRF